MSARENEKTPQAEQPTQQRLTGIEARPTVLENQTTKLDRLVYKLFKRLPREQHPADEADQAAYRARSAAPRIGHAGSGTAIQSGSIRQPSRRRVSRANRPQSAEVRCPGYVAWMMFT